MLSGKNVVICLLVNTPFDYPILMFIGRHLSSTFQKDQRGQVSGRGPSRADLGEEGKLAPKLLFFGEQNCYWYLNL